MRPPGVCGVGHRCEANETLVQLAHSPFVGVSVPSLLIAPVLAPHARHTRLFVVECATSGAWK